MESPENPADTPVIIHVNKAKNVLRKLKSEMQDAAPDALEDESIVNLRKRLVYECEKTFTDPEWRPKMYQLLWMNAFYSTIFVYRGAWKLNQGLKTSEKEAYKTFVSKAKAYLLRLAKTYPDLAYSIYNSVGDIHRYSSELLKSEAEVGDAIKYYGHAVKASPDHGHPFNQLGLLLRTNSPWKAVMMFLRAGIAVEPYPKALDNLNLLKSESFDKLKDVALEYVSEMFSPFSRLLLETPKNNLDEELKSEIEDDKPNYQLILEAFAAVVLGSLNAMLIDKGNDERQRYLINAVSEDFKFLFKEFDEIQRQSPVEDRMKRRINEARVRRKARDDDDDEYKLFSDDEEEEREGTDEEEDSTDEPSTEDTNNPLDPMLPLLALLIEWYTFVDTRLIDKRPSVALRMTLQTMSQLIMDNANKFIEHFQFPENPSNTQIVWLLKTPGFTLPESFYYRLIPLLLKSAGNWTSFPIYFDRYYKAMGKNQEVSTMREMARLRLEHTTSTEKNTQLPSHYLVEAEVIRSRLYVVKTLVNDRTNVLISKSTMRRFDKLKANNQDARTAIRYLEDKTKSGEIKLLTDDFDRSLDVAKAFITSLENSEGVSVLILTANNQPFEKCSDDSVISKEGVDKFFGRYSAMKRRI